MCLFFIIFHDKEKESTQEMGILQEVRILFFLSCLGLGKQTPLSRDPSPQPCSRSVFCVASVALCLRLTMLHCLHAPEADICQGLGARVCCCHLPCEIEL